METSGTTGTPNRRAHIPYIDYLRVFAAVSVVYMHTATYALRITVITRGWHILNLCVSLAFSAVPLFFMISGYLLLSDAKTLRPASLLRRLPRLIAPLASCTALTALWNCCEWHDFTPATFFHQLNEALHAPILTPYWFLYFLIYLYVLSPLLCGAVRALGTDGRRYVVGLTALLSVLSTVRAFLPDAWDRYASMEVFARLQSVWSYILLFLLGYFLGTMERRIPNRILIAGAAGSLAVITLGTWWLFAQNGSYSTAFQDQSAGLEILLASCLFLLAKQNLNRESALLRMTGAVPLLITVYLLHAVFLRVLYYRDVNLMRFPPVLFFTALNLVVSYLLARTLASVKPLCYPFTGMPFAAACRSCNWQSIFRRNRPESAA